MPKFYYLYQLLLVLLIFISKEGEEEKIFTVISWWFDLSYSVNLWVKCCNIYPRAEEVSIIIYNKIFAIFSPSFL